MDEAGRERSPARRWPPGLVVLVGAAAAVVAIAGIRTASTIIASTVLAIVLIVAVLPIGRWALRRGWPSWLAVTVMLVAAYVILLVIVGGLAWSIARLAVTLPGYSDRVGDLTNGILKQLERFGVDSNSASTSLDQLDLGTVVSILQTILSQVLSALGTLAFIVVVLLFLAADTLGLARRWNELMDSKPALARVLAESARGTQRYLVVSAVFGLVVAVLDTGSLYILAVPLPLTWGLLSFLTNFVPNIGFVLGLVPPALLALLEHGVGSMIAVIIVYAVLNVVVQVLIQPRIVGDSVGLSATVTFLALAFWGFVLGPLGALLAVPLTLFVKAAFVDTDPSTRWIRLLISPAPHPAQAPGRLRRLLHRS